MGSHQTFANQALLQAQLFRQCQQKKLYQRALIQVRDTRNDGDEFLSAAILRNNNMTFTQDQLDMRRKAEILQYAGPSTQGGRRESKLKEWSRVNQRFRSFTNYASYLDLSCASLVHNRPTSTTECNVPGPPRMLVYDPNVTLYHFQGMRQDMRQISVPSPPLPPFHVVSYSTNVSEAKYKSGSYKNVESAHLPLNIASITYFNFSEQQTPKCSVSCTLDAIVSFVLVDPSLPAFSNRVPVDNLEFNVNKIEPQIYVMTEPQIFTPDFLLSTVNLTPIFAKLFNKLFMTKINNIYTFGNYAQTYNIANNFLLTFSVTTKTQIKQQTDRIVLNVDFDLRVFDAKNNPINPALSINIEQLTIQFVLTPLNMDNNLGFNAVALKQLQW